MPQTAECLCPATVVGVLPLGTDAYYRQCTRQPTSMGTSTVRPVVHYGMLR